MTLIDTWIPKAPPLREDPPGVVRVGKSRVLLTVLLDAYKQGMTAEELATAFDTVGQANIYAVISYYLENLESVDAYLAEEERKGEEIRKEVESAPGYREFIDGMKARMQKHRD